MFSKSLLTFLTFIYFSMNGFTQSIERLDEKMGFAKFKLEEPFSKYKTDCKLITKKDEKGVEKYEYTKKDIVVVFDRKVKNIFLFSYKSKLYKIEIGFQDSEMTLSLFDVVFANLERLYGPSQPSIMNGKSNIYRYMGYFWNTDKVSLYLSGVQNSDDETKLNSFSISITYRKASEDINNSGF